MAKQNQVALYVSDERLEKIETIREELSQRAGMDLSRNAVICKAIDDLFLTICNSKDTIVFSESIEPVAA